MALKLGYSSTAGNLSSSSSIVLYYIIQTVIKTVADVYSTAIVKAFYDPLKYIAEKDAEQSRCQNTTLFHAVDDRDGFTDVVVQPNLAAMVFV